MNATGEYSLYNQCTEHRGIRLIFHIRGGILADWFIPNIDSLHDSKKIIAVEKNYIKDSSELSLHTHDLISGETQQYELMDTGIVSIDYMSKSKFNASIVSEKDKNSMLNLIMIIPSWGRWTSNKLWLIIIN